MYMYLGATALLKFRADPDVSAHRHTVTVEPKATPGQHRSGRGGVLVTITYMDETCNGRVYPPQSYLRCTRWSVFGTGCIHKCAASPDLAVQRVYNTDMPKHVSYTSSLVGIN